MAIGGTGVKMEHLVFSVCSLFASMFVLISLSLFDWFGLEHCTRGWWCCCCGCWFRFWMAFVSAELRRVGLICLGF